MIVEDIKRSSFLIGIVLSLEFNIVFIYTDSSKLILAVGFT